MTGGDQGDAAAPGADGTGAVNAAPGVSDTLHRLGDEGRATLRAGRDTLRALRVLLAADFALARAALTRAAVCVALAVTFGGSAWLLLMAALIAALQVLGLSWLGALLLAALLSLAVTAAAAWGAVRYFGHTGMQASRRQLSRLGLNALEDLLGGLDDDAARAPSPAAPAPPRDREPQA